MRGWGTKYSTSRMVRDILLEVGEDYPWSVHEKILFRLRREIPPEKLEKLHLPTKQSVAAIMNVCRKLGLLERTRTVMSDTKSYYKRVYYRIRKGKENAIEWQNPLVAYYYPDKFKETRMPPEEKRKWQLTQARKMSEARKRPKGKKPKGERPVEIKKVEEAKPKRPRGRPRTTIPERTVEKEIEERKRYVETTLPEERLRISRERERIIREQLEKERREKEISEEKRRKAEELIEKAKKKAKAVRPR